MAGHGVGASVRDKVVVLHARASAGGGGGPEKTIFNTAAVIDASRFAYHVAYLRKLHENLAPVVTLAARSGAGFFELPGRAVFDFGQWSALAGLIRALRVDILHSHDPKTDFMSLALAPAFPRLRRVTTLHGWVARPESMKSAAYVRLNKLILPSFHAVIAVSRPIAAVARRHGARDVHLVHNAVDPVWWRRENVILPPDDSGRPFTVGFVGRLSHEKGPLVFLDVARRLLATDASVRFVMVGTGPLAEDVRRMAAAPGLAGKVTSYGHIGPEELRTLYAGIDCLLSPSLTEGLPNTLLEALAMGTPVVATDVGGVSDLVRDNETGLLRASGDVSGLAGAVLRIKNEPGLAGRLAGCGRAVVEGRFSFAERSRHLMAIYERLAGRGRIA